MIGLTKPMGLSCQKILKIATTNKFFQFDGQLYEQTDGYALGPLLVNVFMCQLEEKHARYGLMLRLHRKYVDDTLIRMPNTDAATSSLCFSPP